MIFFRINTWCAARVSDKSGPSDKKQEKEKEKKSILTLLLTSEKPASDVFLVSTSRSSPRISVFSWTFFRFFSIFFATFLLFSTFFATFLLFFDFFRRLSFLKKVKLFGSGTKYRQKARSHPTEGRPQKSGQTQTRFCHEEIFKLFRRPKSVVRLGPERRGSVKSSRDFGSE